MENNTKEKVTKASALFAFLIACVYVNWKMSQSEPQPPTIRECTAWETYHMTELCFFDSCRDYKDFKYTERNGCIEFEDRKVCADYSMRKYDDKDCVGFREVPNPFYSSSSAFHF